MILTNCATCAAPLGLALGKKCGRCSTRYCGPACQEQHWKEGGHDKLCKKIKKAGGVEQYHANKKHAEAVAVAAEACAEDTKGQTCYICTQALHWKTKEGLVRGCACCGTAGFAHVSCLVEQVKILYAEAEENNLGDKVLNERLARWDTCSLCEQIYHGVVACALGWACWKTYVGRPETDQLNQLLKGMAMGELGSGLYNACHFVDAMSVCEAQLSMERRLGWPEGEILVVQGNLANTYQLLGRSEALRLRKNVYCGYVRIFGIEHRRTLLAAGNYAVLLVHLERFEEAKELLHRIMPVARRVLEESDEQMLRMRWNYAMTLYKDTGSATLGDLREAVNMLEDLTTTARRVLGGANPLTGGIENSLLTSRAALGVCEPPPPSGSA